MLLFVLKQSEDAWNRNVFVKVVIIQGSSSLFQSIAFSKNALLTESYIDWAMCFIAE